MSKFWYETAVSINAPIETVYSYLTDFPRHVEWSHQPQEINPLNGNGETAVGSKYRTDEASRSNMPLMQRVLMAVMMPFMKRKHDFEGHIITEITDMQPNQRMAWTSYMPNRNGKKLMQAFWEIRFEAQSGGTQVIQRGEIAPPADSPFVSMIDEQQVEVNKAESEINLKRLKAILEA